MNFSQRFLLAAIVKKRL